MPLKHLTIRLGGLCMLVQRPPENFFVLMPAMNSQHPHCPVVRIPGRNIGQRDERQIPIAGLSIDWRNLATATGTLQQIDWFVDASAVAGKIPVDNRWLNESPRDCLAARIQLPLGPTKPERGNNERAKLRVNRGGTLGEKIEACGVAVLDLDVEKANVMQLTVAGQVVVPHNNQIELTFLNVPPGDLKNPRRLRHWKGDKVHHVRGYFELLQGGCRSTGTSWPEIVVDENVEDGADPWPDHSTCPDGPEDIPSSVRALFIDPYNCTIGGGS